MEDFKEILNELVSKTGLSLRDLAKVSGVSAMQYSRYLRGYIPTIKVTLKIAKYFDCSVDYLFGLDNKINNQKYKTYYYDISNFVCKYKKLLKANNTSNFKFAQHVFFDESALRRWEKGAEPRLDIIFTIAKELGGSMDDLIGRK